MAVAERLKVSHEFTPIIEEKKIPPSAKTVLDLLKNNGPLTAKDILRECKLAPRTVRYALKKLLDAKIIQRLPNLNDMRQNVYQISKIS